MKLLPFSNFLEMLICPPEDVHPKIKHRTSQLAKPIINISFEQSHLIEYDLRSKFLIRCN